MSEANRDLTLFVRGQLKRRMLRFIGSSLKGLAVDSQGNAWVASLKEDSVYGIRPNGSIIGQFKGGGINAPWDVTVDGEDNLWVSNFGPLDVTNNFRVAESRSSAGSTGPPAPWGEDRRPDLASERLHDALRRQRGTACERQPAVLTRRAAELLADDAPDRIPDRQSRQCLDDQQLEARLVQTDPTATCAPVRQRALAGVLQCCSCASKPAARSASSTCSICARPRVCSTSSTSTFCAASTVKARW